MLLIKKPLVSICIPTYNGEQFIAEAMDSAIGQTYPNLEIIVSDDASSDDTLSIIETYKVKTAIPIYVYNHTPNGIGANWNNCIRKANGVYIKFLFQDDILQLECITEMVNLIETDKSVSLVSCKRDFIVENSFLNDTSHEWIEKYKDLQKGLDLSIKNNILYLDNNIFKHHNFFKSPLNKVGEPTTILFEKKLIDLIGFFREDLAQVLDYEFCYRVFKYSKIAIINYPLVKFRLHGRQATVINKENDIYYIDHEIFTKIIYDEYFKFLDCQMKKVLARKYNYFVSFFYNSIDWLKSKT